MKDIFNSLNKLLLIYAKDQRYKYYFFISLNLLVTFLEIISLGLLFPFLSLIIDPNFIIKFQGYNIYFLKDLNFNQILILLLILLMGFFLLKNIIIGFINLAQIKYSVFLQNKIATTLLKKYLFSEYLFHKKNDSSKLIRIINSDSYIAITGFIIPSFFLFTEIFIFLGIIILLAFYEIYGLLIAFILSVVSFYIYKKFSKALQQHGILRQDNETLKIRYAKNIFEGIKEILFYRKQYFFYDLYKNVNLKVNKSMSFLESVKILPRLFLEVFGVIVFCVVMIFLIINEKDLSKLLPLLGVYLVAAFKILPSLNRIISSAQQMKFNKVYIESLIAEHADEKNDKYRISNEQKDIKNISFEKQIELKNINFDYKTKNRSNSVLKNINLSFDKNSITAIIGRSGSGKSTIVDILLGLIKQDSGQILVDGKNIDTNILKLKIGYVPQINFLLNDTIKNNIAIGVPEKNINLDKIDKAIKLSNLEKDFDKSKITIDTIVGEKALQISGGQAQRIAIARSLYDDPEIIIFDEATSSLDTLTEKEIFENMLILKKTKSILLITHSDKILKYCDKVISLDKNENMI